MLDPFGIALRIFARDADSDQQIDDEAVAGAHASGEVEAGVCQEDAPKFFAR